MRKLQRYDHYHQSLDRWGRSGQYVRAEDVKKLLSTQLKQVQNNASIDDHTRKELVALLEALRKNI